VGTSLTGPLYNEGSNRSLDHFLSWLDLSLTRDLALMVAHSTLWHVGPLDPRQRLQWFRLSRFDSGSDQYREVPKSRVSKLTQRQTILIVGIYLSQLQRSTFEMSTDVFDSFFPHLNDGEEVWREPSAIFEHTWIGMWMLKGRIDFGSSDFLGQELTDLIL